MDPTDLVGCDRAEPRTRSRMIRSARNAGWTMLAERLEAGAAVTMEQEQIPVCLPDANRAG